MAKNVILDCDTGGDDAIAILFACKSDELDVHAVTTVTGNEKVGQCTENTLYLLEYIGREDVPVGRGCEEPLIRPHHSSTHFHGKKGMGNIERGKPLKEPSDKHGVDLMIQKAKELGNVTLIPTGPLTNIAMALKKDPSIKQNIQEISLMGGAFQISGNATPTGEYNIIQDPEAARIVCESGIPLKIAPLDATRKLLTKSVLSKLEPGKSKAAEIASRIIKGEWEWVTSQFGVKPHPHDSLAVYLAMGEEKGLKMKKVAVDVETKGELTYGQTVGDFRKRASPWAGLYSKEGQQGNEGLDYLPGKPPREPNAEVCMKADSEVFNKVLASALNS